jgi:transposase
MKDFLIAGVDVSKLTLDIYLKPSGQRFTIANSQQGFEQWFEGFRMLLDDDVKVLVVMEHTGQYSRRFEVFLRTHGIDYCKVNALQIKRSMGMIRGKNDQVDAERISEFGWLRRHTLIGDEDLSGPVKKLRSLMSLRQNLVRSRSGMINRLKETISSGDCFKGDDQWQILQGTVDHLSSQIKEVERRMKSLIASHESLQKTCELLCSIKGIGWLIASYMISSTDNFRLFKNARKFNCYAGIAPFTHQSGTSIKTKSRVSHLANKEAKTLLNLAAFSAIRFNPEIKQYYQRRVAEGKNKMSCINAVRSKLVARIFAVAKRQTPYQTTFPQPL